MIERFVKVREDQLNTAIAVVATLCVLMLFLFSLLLFTTAGNGVRARFLPSNATVTPEPVANLLPPTWTPRATNTPTTTPTATLTSTPVPTNTRVPSRTPTRTVTATATAEGSPTPDFAATVAAAQSMTPVPTTVPPQIPAPPVVIVPTAPPVPVIPPPPPPPPPVVIVPPPVPPTPTLPPSPIPLPTATPLPLYVLAELLGGPNCGYSGISGTVRGADGAPLPGVTVSVFNEFGYAQEPVTDANGVYQVYLDSQPRPDLAGPWHIRVLEGGVQQSNEIVVLMSGSCTAGENEFIANFYRSR